MTATEEKRTFTVNEAAEAIGVDYSTVLACIHKGHIKAKRKGFGKTSPFEVPLREVEKAKRVYGVDC